MKGMVFTEFLEWVEATSSPALADRIITAADLPNDGAYTSVGHYDHAELDRLVEALAAETSAPTAELMGALGAHLAGRFASAFPALFEAQPGALAFLAKGDDHIQAEVRRLYPDAELPRLEVLSSRGDALELRAHTPHQWVDLAVGLITGVGQHYATPLDVRELDRNEDGARLRVALVNPRRVASAQVHHANSAV